MPIKKDSPAEKAVLAVMHATGDDLRASEAALIEAAVSFAATSIRKSHTPEHETLERVNAFIQGLREALFTRL